MSSRNEWNSDIATDEGSRPTDTIIVRFAVVANVAIDTRHLGELPGFCVKTGEPTRTTRQQDFADIPGWTLLLIFWGLIPFLLAAGFARRKITVDLPASEKTLRRVRAVDIGAVAGLVLGIGLLVISLVSEEAASAWAGIAVALLTLVAAAVARQVVWVTGRLEGEALWLYGVHLGFTEKAQALAPPDLAHRLSTRRWATGFLVAAVIALILVFLFVRVGA